VLLALEERLRQAVVEFAARHWQVELANVAIEQPPRPELGDLALPFCFELARRLRRAPRALAQEFAASFPLPEGFARVEAAGSGYLNFFVRRSQVFAALAGQRRDPGLQPRLGGKAIVEHTNINPNKAAHIGHLRNAALGDTFVRLLRYRGENVEVQNYIDNTGVQVADVAAAFEHVLHQDAAALRAEIAGWEEKRQRLEREGAISAPPQNLPLAAGVTRAAYSFDYRCWDLYAQISRHYEEQPDALAWRGAALAAIEHGGNETAALAEAVADAIVTCHLRTMRRLNVAYDLLPRESEILRLHFWDAAFERLKRSGAIRRETAGKNAGCWVMDLGTAGPEEGEGEDSKVIVRSNGTVTYVGKDIAYQLWKLGKLGRDFHYRRWSSAPGAPWVTDTEGAADAPSFGGARWVFNVIDARQAYLQDIVAAGLRALGEQEAAEHSVHFSYEMVALSPRCAEQLGLSLSPEARQRAHVEVSGRKGFGIKADDLMDQLIQSAGREVQARHPERDEAAQLALAEPIAIGALRYFLLKFTKNALIAFDLDEALSFEGETGPYVQYAAVRAGNILRKGGEEGAAAEQPLAGAAAPDDWEHYLEPNELWELVQLAARLESVAEQAIVTTEPAYLAKYAFQLAQAFNNFYHRTPVLAEADAGRRAFLLRLVAVTRQRLAAALDLLGIAVPEAM